MNHERRLTSGRAPVGVLRLVSLVACLIVIARSAPAAAQSDPFPAQSEETTQVIQTDVTTPASAQAPS